MDLDPREWSVSVAAAISDEMAARDRSVDELAELLGIAVETVTRRLTGVTPFDLVEVERIASWLGLSPADLVARADEPPS